MTSRAAISSTRAVKILCLACLLAMALSATGCGSGPFGLGTEDLKAEKEWSDKIESSIAAKKAAKEASGQVSPDGTVMQMVDRPEGEPVLMWKAGNDGGIEGGGGRPATVKQDKAYFVTEVCAYHFNGGAGAPAGEITLKAADGTVYGPWKTTLRSKVYWIAEPNLELPAGTYTLIDSDPSTWAQNSQSNGKGMGWAYGIPVK